jgi:hypothetical protein
MEAKKSIIEKYSLRGSVLPRVSLRGGWVGWGWGGGGVKGVLAVSAFIILFWGIVILIMGGEKSQVKGKQAQLVEQNYSNNIMLLAFSTLESVCCKILNADSSSAAKRFGRQDKVDYSLKSMQELIVQLKTHLLIFKASKQSMDSDFKGFVFPK